MDKNIGKKFNKLTILRLAEYQQDKPPSKRKYTCKCDCGNITNIRFDCLKNEQSKSCGCDRGKWTVHGLRYHPLYRTWSSMKERCSNINSPNYHRYGGRGIKVCDRWQASFEKFLEDMGEKTSPDLSIDRIDVNGNYEPSNCRWATRIEQANNKEHKPIATNTNNVYYDKRYHKYHIEVYRRGKKTKKSGYKTLEEAIAARDKLIAELDKNKETRNPNKYMD